MPYYQFEGGEIIVLDDVAVDAFNDMLAKDYDGELYVSPRVWNDGFIVSRPYESDDKQITIFIDDAEIDIDASWVENYLVEVKDENHEHDDEYDDEYDED